MKKYLYVLILLIIIFSLLNCSSNSTIIYGQFLTTPGKSLRGYRIQLGLMSENKEWINDYYTSLSRSGKFRFKVREQGNFIAFIGLNQFPPGNVRPHMSTDDGRVYMINTIDNKKILIDRYLFITEPLRIFAPTEGESIFVDKDFLIKWQEDVLADGYFISFYQRDEESRAIISSISALIRESSITIKDFFVLPAIEGAMDIEEVESLIPVARIDGELSSGKYFLEVRGYRVILEESRRVDTSRSETIVVNLVIP